MLTARTDAKAYVEAAAARRGETYRCRQCGAPVIFKPGRVRTAHFAHRPDGACAFGARMSAAHLTAQGVIAAALRARGLSVELEAPLPGEGGGRRIDVLAWPPRRPRARVAIEVQASDLTAALIEARTASYQALGVAVLWLRLLDFAAFKAVQTLPFTGALWIERYRARAWERWAHDNLGGRLWFMDSGTALAWRGAFTAAHRFRERALLRGAAGEPGGRGADWTEAAQWVDLALDGPYALEDLRLGRGAVDGPDGHVRRFAWFVSPDEGDVRPPFPAPVRAAFSVERAGQSRTLQTRFDGDWVSASPEGARSDWRTRRAAPREPLRAPTRR